MMCNNPEHKSYKFPKLPTNGVYRSLKDQLLYHVRTISEQKNHTDNNFKFVLLFKVELKRYKTDESWRAVETDELDKLKLLIRE